MTLDVDCDRIEEFISPELVLEINRFVTEPESFDADNRIRNLGESNHALDVGRSEDFHGKLSFGIVESLIQTILPQKCGEDKDVIYLTSLIIDELASSQAFNEGNKRTAYLSGMIFLKNVQKDKGFDRTVFPVLNQDFVEILQDLAVKNEDRTVLEKYIRNGIEQTIEEIQD